MKEIRVKGKYRVEKKDRELLSYFAGWEGDTAKFIIYWKGGIEEVRVKKENFDDPIVWPLLVYCVNKERI